jgi:hypothetical protein
LKAAQEAVDPTTKEVERLHKAFATKNDDAWYVRVVDAVSLDSEAEDALMKLVRDEMAQFYDVVKDKEFRQIEQKYSSSRIVLVKLMDKVNEVDT